MFVPGRPTKIPRPNKVSEGTIRHENNPYLKGRCHQRVQDLLDSTGTPSKLPLR